MRPSFRASMSELHTWSGAILGSLLFAIFWTGTLSVFDREIDMWMAPATRLPYPETFSTDMLLPSLEQAAQARAPVWAVRLPTERQPAMRVTWRDASRRAIVQHLDPGTGALLPDPGTLGGTRFLYPFHYMLHIRIHDIGFWIVGAAAMGMLLACVSGVIVHRRIFRDFFTLRRTSNQRRWLLDLHNVAGVLALPFHIAITLSGLIVFAALYFPSTWRHAHDGRAAFFDETLGSYARPRLGVPGPAPSLDAVLTEARRLWPGEALSSLAVFHPGDAASYTRVRRPFEHEVTLHTDAAYFDTASGKLLHDTTRKRPVLRVQNFITGLHLIQFRHWTLRWVYFLLGLSGCVLIATGSLFWLEARRVGHAPSGRGGVRLVDGLTIGSVTGIIAATLAFLIANRLLPLGTAFAGWQRSELEVWAFYLVWIAAFAHAGLRPVRRAWIEQCATLAALAIAAVLLNWLTTGDSLWRSLAQRHLWPVAGVDLLLLLVTAIALWFAVALGRRNATARARIAREVTER